MSAENVWSGTPPDTEKTYLVTIPDLADSKR